MKTRTFALTIATCLTSGLFVATVQAQPSDADKAAKRQEVTQALGLSETQATQMQAIHEAAQASHQALREQGRESGDREAVRTEMEALRADTDAKVQNVLTPEQYTKLQELRPERGERGGHGPGKGRADGSGRGKAGGDERPQGGERGGKRGGSR